MIAVAADLSGLIGFDHPIIGVANLDSATRQWERLGFAMTPMGRHIGWATANRCIMFAESYVELLGIVDPSGYTHGLADRLNTDGEGAIGYALTSRDADLTYHAFVEAGIAGEPPKRLERLLDLPTGTVRPAFRLVHPEPTDALGVRAFACHHLTPELIRQPAWLTHPNGATGIAIVTIAVPSPAAVTPTFQQLVGEAGVVAAPQGTTVRVGGTTLAFGPADRVGGIIGLGISVKDVKATRTWLDHHHVPFIDNPSDGTIDVAPTHANGVALTFLPG